MKSIWILIFVLITSFAHADSVTLAWDANTEPDLAGYKIYWGFKSREYPNVVDVGNVTEHTITTIPAWVLVFYAATAYDTDGNESGYSEEINHVVIPEPFNLRRK